MHSERLDRRTAYIMVIRVCKGETVSCMSTHFQRTYSIDSYSFRHRPYPYLHTFFSCALFPTFFPIYEHFFFSLAIGGFPWKMKCLTTSKYCWKALIALTWLWQYFCCCLLCHSSYVHPIYSTNIGFDHCSMKVRSSNIYILFDIALF